MIRVMKRRAARQLVSALVVFCLALAAGAQEKPQKKPKTDNIQKPMAGPRATALRVTWLYVAGDQNSQKVGRVQIGREMVVAEHSGPWIRVYANTDTQQEHEQDSDTPWIGDPDSTPPPVSGWIEARGVVIESTPNGDQILLGEAANEEALASDPRGPANAAKSARLLYRRLVEMFPNSPLVPEAAWRAADILWQIQKADVTSRPSAKERDAYMREQIDEYEMKKVLKLYPRTRQADLAAFEMIDNKLCGDWQGEEKCPEKESEIYEKYAADFPDGPRTARALYEAAYRQAVLVDMFNADGADKKAEPAKAHAKELAGRLKDKFPQSDYASRAAALIYRLDEGIPVYGIDRQ
jgi:hypothetical protein